MAMATATTMVALLILILKIGSAMILVVLLLLVCVLMFAFACMIMFQFLLILGSEGIRHFSLLERGSYFNPGRALFGAARLVASPLLVAPVGLGAPGWGRCVVAFLVVVLGSWIQSRWGLFWVKCDCIWISAQAEIEIHCQFAENIWTRRKFGSTTALRTLTNL